MATAPMTDDMRELMRALRGTYLLDDPSATELWLIRHADAYEHALPEDGAFDPCLSPLGRRQAERLGWRLAGAGIGAVYTSDALRARETGAVACRYLNLAPAVLEDLGELRLTPDDGVEQMAGVLVLLRSVRERMVRGETAAWPWDVETHEAGARRLAAAIDELAARHPGERVAVISHGAVINAYLGELLGLAAGLRVYPEYTGVSVVRARQAQRSVGCINDASHLQVRAPVTV
jgi:probable phosphoglycerate mutase